jgi:hypothetical protein
MLAIAASVYGQLSFEQEVYDILKPYLLTKSADLNNDGTDDLVIVTIHPHISGIFPESEENNIEIYLNKSGEFILQQVIKYYDGNMTNIDICDIDGDGLKDIVISNGIAHLTIYKQDENNMFSPCYTYSLSYTHIDQMKCIDLNNDGLTDIVLFYSVYNSSLGGQISQIDILYQRESLVFDTVRLIPKEYPYNFDKYDIADINNDNLPDIVFFSNTGIIYVLLNSIDGFVSSRIPILKEINGIRCNNIALGYVNGDSLIDIVITAGSNNDPTLFIAYQKENEDLSFRISSIVTKDIPNYIEIVDLNNDSRNDIVINHDLWQTISIFEQIDNEVFDIPVLYPDYFGNMNNNGWTFGDFNGDGLIDIFVPALGSYFFLWNTSENKSSDIKTVTVNNLDNIRLFPNPVNDFLNFNIEKSIFQNVRELEFYLLSLDGKILKKLKIYSESNSINMLDLQSGIYLYKVMSKGELIKSGKIIKQ